MVEENQNLSKAERKQLKKKEKLQRKHEKRMAKIAKKYGYYPNENGEVAATAPAPAPNPAPTPMPNPNPVEQTTADQNVAEPKIEEPKAEEPKKAEPKAEEPKKVEPKKAEPKKADDKKDNSEKAKNYHISQRKEDGKWQVKAEGAEKALKLFDTQAEAIAFAKEKAENQEGNITIHKKDRKIRKQSY